MISALTLHKIMCFGKLTLVVLVACTVCLTVVIWWSHLVLLHSSAVSEPRASGILQETHFYNNRLQCLLFTFSCSQIGFTFLRLSFINFPAIVPDGITWIFNFVIIVIITRSYTADKAQSTIARPSCYTLWHFSGENLFMAINHFYVIGYKSYQIRRNNTK